MQARRTTEATRSRPSPAKAGIAGGPGRGASALDAPTPLRLGRLTSEGLLRSRNRDGFREREFAMTDTRRFTNAQIDRLLRPEIASP